MSRTIAVIAAHPDDEALGAGGTIARHAARGDAVHIIFMTDGVAARGSKKGAQERHGGALKAAEILGAKQVHFLDFPDNRMDTVALLDVAQKIEPLLAGIKPHIIYTHHSGDLNVDHRAVHQAVLTACRPQPGSGIEAIYGFEVLSSTEWASPGAANAFMPVHYVDITEFMDKKLESLRQYDQEMRPFPHSRSYETVQALAAVRGSCMGVKAAEAFTVIRQISF